MASAIENINIGDVIVFNYYGILHEGIVIKGSKKRGKVGSVKVIHYGTDGLFSKRTIMEELFNFDLGNQTVQIKSYRCSTFEPETVVKRARSRLGEQRHSVWHNRSCHFVEWAKVGMQPISYCTTPYRKLHLYEVYTWDDLEKGSIVDFRYYGIRHQGVLTSTDPRRREITVIHYGTTGFFATRTIMYDTVKINFKTDSLKVYRCDDGEHNTPDDVVRKAKSRISEASWGAGNRSWDFCLQCLFESNESEWLPLEENI